MTDAMPTTVGLCPDPHCTGEFYMPDAKPGDPCPMDHGGEDCPALVIFTRPAFDEDHEHDWRAFYGRAPKPGEPSDVLPTEMVCNDCGARCPYGEPASDEQRP